jgi:hypothetical protein
MGKDKKDKDKKLESNAGTDAGASKEGSKHESSKKSRRKSAGSAGSAGSAAGSVGSQSKKKSSGRRASDGGSKRRASDVGSTSTTKKRKFEDDAREGRSVHSADTAKTRESMRKDNFRATNVYEGRLRDEKADEQLKKLTSVSTAESISVAIQQQRSQRSASQGSNASILSYPDTEAEVIIMPPAKKKGPPPLGEAKDEIKRKLNLKRTTNKEGRQDVYHSIVKCLNEIEDLTKQSLEVLMVNKEDEDHLPIIKGFAESKGLFARRKEKCIEMLGEDKQYLDHVRLHRQCLVDGVMFDSKRIYNDASYAADMNTIKTMKRGIMKLVGKNPDEWEYDPEEFEELRRVRGQLQKVWGGHLLKKQKQLDKLRGQAPMDVDKQAGMEQMKELIKKGAGPSMFQAKGMPVAPADFGGKRGEKVAKQLDKLTADGPAAPSGAAPGQGPNQRRRKSEQIENGEQWAQNVAQAAVQPAQEAPPPPAVEQDMAAYSVDEDEGEIDIPQEISDAMDSFIGDKFYKMEVGEVPDGKGKKFAGKLVDGKPDGRGALILGDRSQHIGNFRKGKASGLGVLLNRANDSIYAGSWVENRKIGRFFVLEKATGVTYLERYESGDQLAERQAGPALPAEVIKERFLKKLARLKAKEPKDGGAADAGGEIENRRGSAGDVGEETRSRASKSSKRRASADDAQGGSKGGGRRNSLPKI